MSWGLWRPRRGTCPAWRSEKASGRKGPGEHFGGSCLCSSVAHDFRSWCLVGAGAAPSPASYASGLPGRPRTPTPTALRLHFRARRSESASPVLIEAGGQRGACPFPSDICCLWLPYLPSCQPPLGCLRGTPGCLPGLELAKYKAQEWPWKSHIHLCVTSHPRYLDPWAPVASKPRLPRTQRLPLSALWVLCSSLWPTAVFLNKDPAGL